MNIWKQVLARIEQLIDRTEYESWLAPTRFLQRKGDTIDIGVPSQRFVDEIRERYGQQIRAVLNELTPDERVQVHFVVDPIDNDTLDDLVPIGTPPREELPNAIFNPRYRFSTFVVGNSNQLAYAASLSVAENPSGSFNPLFIYGGAGLGKTHLIQAIGQQLREGATRRKVVYMSADSFVTDLITSIRYDKMQSFRDRYRTVDALLLDDIQFLAGKERTQEEFFHTFNDLYESRKQIIVSSDCSPKDIPEIEERLRSRFEWGLIADIQPPDFETRVAILRKKAALERVRLDDDVAFLIAGRIKSNIRELEGSLTRMIAFCALTGREMGVELAKEVLADLWGEEEKIITIDQVQRKVSDFFGVKISDLKAKNRTKAVAFPRQVAMYLARYLTHSSLAEVGRAFGGKDHTTVLHAVDKIQTLLQEDPKLKKTIDGLIQGIQL